MALTKAERQRLNKVLSDHWSHTKFALVYDKATDKTELSWYGHPNVGQVRDVLYNERLWDSQIIAGIKWSRSMNDGLSL